MAESKESSEPGQSSDDESLKHIFDDGMKLFDSIENSKEPSNSDPIQMLIRAAIAKFEKATQLVSFSGMFSRNESLEELPTETLQYLLLPALLGTLTLKLFGRQTRREIINVAEIYFRDFLQRCKDYGVTDIEIPQPKDENSQENVECCQTEQAKIANMIQTRESKIKRYMQAKELKEKLSNLSKNMERPNVDDETKREYFTTMLQTYINEAVDELVSIDHEKPILEYMENRGEKKKQKPDRPHHPLKPVIITRDAMQKAVYGLGYPSIPTMTIEEFYDNRVREGLFPGSCTSIPYANIKTPEEDPDEAAKIAKETLVENEDPEERARQQAMDEYKDEHRRGSGNRHNRS